MFFYVQKPEQCLEYSLVIVKKMGFFRLLFYKDFLITYLFC